MSLVGARIDGHRSDHRCWNIGIHFGMPGSIQQRTLVYTVVIATFLTLFFDLSRIALLGAIFYLVMDIAVHWGLLKYLRKQINANAFILITAIVFDVVVPGVFLKVKASSDILVIYAALIGTLIIFAGEKIFLSRYNFSNCIAAGGTHDLEK